MPARSVCLVTLSLSEAGPGRFGRQASVTDIYHAMPCHTSSHSGSTSLSADMCFHTCDLLAQMSVGAALCCTSTRQRCS